MRTTVELRDQAGRGPDGGGLAVVKPNGESGLNERPLGGVEADRRGYFTPGLPLLAGALAFNWESTDEVRSFSLPLV